MRAFAKELKQVLARLEFKTYVRTDRDPVNPTWVGVVPYYAASQKRTDEIAALLRGYGYRVEVNGKPGTSGQYIVEVWRQ